MKKLIITYLLLIIVTICFSQGITNITRQIPLTENQIFAGIYCTDSLTSFASGAGGLILKTNNGGETWYNIETNTNHNLHTICFANDSVGFCIGDVTTLLKTNDFGETWTTCELDVSVYLSSIHFFNDSVGCIVCANGIVLWTNNQGESWDQQNSPTSTNLNEVFVINKDTAIAVGPGSTIIRTTNAGENWAIIDFPYTNINIKGIEFYSNNQGVLIGESTYKSYCYLTEDCGETWENIEFPWSSDAIYDIQFIDSLHGYISCKIQYDEYVFTAFAITRDGGRTWLPRGEIQSNLFCMADTITGFSIPLYSNQIHKTNNGGHGFFSSYDNSLKNLNSIDFVDTMIGCCIGNEGQIITTENAGENWILRDPPTSKNLNYIKCLDENNWFAVGDSGLIIKSSDLGLNWTEQNSNTENNLYTIINTSENLIIVAGDNGTILRSTNYGETWQDISLLETPRLHAGNFVNDSTGFISGYHNIYETTDYGESWSLVYDQATFSKYSYFVNKDIGYYANRNKIYKTTDNCNSWTCSFEDNESSGNVDIHHVKFYDENFGIFTGIADFESGTTGYYSRWSETYFTLDGGENWQPLSTEILNSILFVNSNNGFMVGEHGCIYKFDFEINNILETLIEVKSVVFPNPSDGHFTLGLYYNSEIEIYNHSGQIVSKMKLDKGVNTINLPSLESGIYTIRINYENTYQIHKLLITK